MIFCIISPENKPKKEIIQTLVRRGYDPDPVKAWKESQNKLQVRTLSNKYVLYKLFYSKYWSEELFWQLFTVPKTKFEQA